MKRTRGWKVHHEYEYEVIAILPALELVFTDSGHFQHGKGTASTRLRSIKIAEEAFAAI